HHLVGPFVLFSLLTTGCSTLNSWYGWVDIHKSAKGSVYLQEVADWSFKADHPVAIDHATLLSTVQGIVAEDVKNLSTNLPAGGSKPMRVFSDEDAEFLAPLLAQGLSQAKPEQIVGFTVSSSAGSGAEPAAGTLYLSKGSLYVTITPTDNRKVSGFTPSLAARIERAPAYTSDWSPGTLAMVINPRILAKMQTPAAPTFAAEPASHAGSDTAAGALTNLASGQDITDEDLTDAQLEELQLAREANKTKDAEISALRKEVEWMKHELRERSATTETVSKRVPSKKKSAEAYQNR
ncbi:MAG: hypothetical protein OEY28_14575, partial [Nitrospira sp.]|nr:hypothetical protein [Nitrospira sp.]